MEESTTPSAISPQANAFWGKIRALAFPMFFAWTIGSYILFYAVRAIPDNAELGGILVLGFYEISTLIIVAILFFIFRSLEKRLSGSGRTAYWIIGSLSIAYWLFASFIFRSIGQTFTVQLSAPKNVQLGDTLTVQVIPSSGFYTHNLATPIILTKPDGSTIQSQVYFSMTGKQGCGLFFTITWCTPTNQIIKLNLPITAQDHFQSTPFQFDEAGTYALSSPDPKVQGTSIAAAAPANGLPPVLKNNAVITGIPGMTLQQENVSFDDSGFLTFHAYYLSPNNELYTVSRVKAAELDAQQQVNTCAGQRTAAPADCPKISYTLRNIGATTTLNGSVFFVTHSWTPAFTAAQVASNPSSKYFDEVYWLSGNALLEIYYNNNSGHYTAKNAYDGAVFQAYSKQYLSTL